MKRKIGKSPRKTYKIRFFSNQAILTKQVLSGQLVNNKCKMLNCNVNVNEDTQIDYNKELIRAKL